MALLTVQGLSKYWGATLLFKGVGFLLNEGEKIALVGRNGAGKTTLLKILMGRMEYDEGTIRLAGGCRIGYLSQDPDLQPGRTVLEEAQSVFGYLEQWERELRALEDRMGAASDELELEAVMTEYTRITAHYEAARGYEGPARVRVVLSGLGFDEHDLVKPVEVLSGGQKVRLGLAKLLLETPDLMLLDEPINHLDLQATEWLEEYFKSIKSAAILVSHDRYFLDKVIAMALELDNHGAEIFHGNFSYYLNEKKRRQDSALTLYERQQREAARLETFYLKWRNTPSRKDQAQSRKKLLDRMEIMEKPQTSHKNMKLGFEPDSKSGNDVLQIFDLAKSFGERVIFSDVNLQLFKGDRVALTGPNGAGKTTFLKIAHGLLRQDRGKVYWGVGVERGYFSQDLDTLDPTRTAFEEMLEIPGFTKFDAYSLLGRFMFSGEEAHKSIGQCSGGERNRLILAKLVVAGSNVLLLDEPTNHLDLASKQVLEEALTEFTGTVLFVSHDRYFIDRVATKVWEFAGGRVKQYEGNYTAYRAELERLALLAVQEGEATSPRWNSAEDERRKRREAARLAKEEEKKAAELLRRLESDIQRLEERKVELEGKMANPEIYRTDNGREVVLEYNAVCAELDRLYMEWEQGGNMEVNSGTITKH